MKQSFKMFLFAFLSCIACWGLAQAQVQVGLSVGDQGLNHFYLSIGDYYQVPEQQVVVVQRRHIPDEELPVVFFIAQQAQVSPDTVVQMRLGGQSWVDIALHFNLSPEVFYVPLKRVSGPPYGKAWGYYKHHKEEEEDDEGENEDQDEHDQWEKSHLTDQDIVNFVDLKFISERYQCSPDQIVKWRSHGRNFVRINEDARSGWVKKHGEEDGNGQGDERDHEKGDDHGHGHGHGHGHHDEDNGD